MADIYLAIAIICLLSAALFVAGLRIAAKLRRRWALLVAALTVLGLVIFRFTLQDHTVFLRLVPFSSASSSAIPAGERPEEPPSRLGSSGARPKPISQRA